MGAWPGGTIGSMRVDNFHGGTRAVPYVNASASRAQFVSDARIDFSVDVTYTDHPFFDHGVGEFRVQLSRFTEVGWQPVASTTKRLGDDSHDGDWSDVVVVSTTMTEPFELYRIDLHCETQQTSFGTSGDASTVVTALMTSLDVGELVLDFIPLSIVYSPPGRNMSNSLTQSTSYGTRFTLGESSSFKAETAGQARMEFFGIVGTSVGFSTSQSVANQSTNGIQVSHFRTTVVTADNQRAIEATHWGPLGDLFVVLVNPRFSMSRRADGTIFYTMRSIQQLIVVPAWKLLRPGDDPIAAAIPPSSRRRLLELDPFIRNLDRFFPTDAGDDLSTAAAPHADPSAGNRADLLGRWWLDNGSVLSYSEGESRQLSSTIANEVRYEARATIEARAGVDVAGVRASLGISHTDTLTVGFQRSRETSEATSRTAACLLLRGDDESDHDAIDIFYDKIFSTFMFRRVRRRRIRPEAVGDVAAGALSGLVRGRDGAPLRGAEIVLRGRGGEQRTSTSESGAYTFVNLAAGSYVLEVGDTRQPVEVPQDASPERPHVLDLRGVRRRLDLRAAPVWEVQDALGVPSDVVRRIAAGLGEVGSAAKLARVAGVRRDVSEAWADRVQLTWPRRTSGKARRRP